MSRNVCGQHLRVNECALCATTGEDVDADPKRAQDAQRITSDFTVRWLADTLARGLSAGAMMVSFVMFVMLCVIRGTILGMILPSLYVNGPAK